MARIDGVDPDWAEKPLRAVFEAQAKKWGAGYVERIGIIGSDRLQARRSRQP